MSHLNLMLVLLPRAKYMKWTIYPPGYLGWYDTRWNWSTVTNERPDQKDDRQNRHTVHDEAAEFSKKEWTPFEEGWLSLKRIKELWKVSLDQSETNVTESFLKACMFLFRLSRCYKIVYTWDCEYKMTPEYSRAPEEPWKSFTLKGTLTQQTTKTWYQNPPEYLDNFVLLSHLPRDPFFPSP
jgi:hypothetical protein